MEIQIIKEELKLLINERQISDYAFKSLNGLFDMNFMAYIYYNKESGKHRLFGSLPVMCKTCELDYTYLQYAFRNNKTEYETETLKIIKVTLERGGKNK